MVKLSRALMPHWRPGNAPAYGALGRATQHQAACCSPGGVLVVCHCTQVARKQAMALISHHELRSQQGDSPFSAQDACWPTFSPMQHGSRHMLEFYCTQLSPLRGATAKRVPCQKRGSGQSFLRDSFSHPPWCIPCTCQGDHRPWLNACRSHQLTSRISI